MSEYRKTTVEVKPGYKKPDSVVEKKLTALQIEALNAIIALVDGGSTITIYNEDNKKVAGCSAHQVRVSTERWQRWPSRDGKVDVSKQTLKPLIEANLVTAYNSRYSPDLVITEAGIKAAASGVYGKVVNGDWVPAVSRPMTPAEQKEADIEWLTGRMEYHKAKVTEQAEAIAERLEDAARQIRRAGEEISPERSRRWGSDSLYCSNGISSNIRNTFNNLRLDILTDAEANMLTSMVRLDAINGKELTEY